MATKYHHFGARYFCQNVFINAHGHTFFESLSIFMCHCRKKDLISTFLKVIQTQKFIFNNFTENLTDPHSTIVHCCNVAAEASSLVPSSWQQRCCCCSVLGAGAWLPPATCCTQWPPSERHTLDRATWKQLLLHPSSSVLASFAAGGWMAKPRTCILTNFAAIGEC